MILIHILYNYCFSQAFNFCTHNDTGLDVKASPGLVVESQG